MRSDIWLTIQAPTLQRKNKLLLTVLLLVLHSDEKPGQLSKRICYLNCCNLHEPEAVPEVDSVIPVPYREQGKTRAELN
jgi:hypothetical protein